jgi:hypothetical protein
VPLVSTIFPIGSNSTITATSSPQVGVSGSGLNSPIASQSSSLSPSFARNLTTSATIISSPSTTYTSFTTFQRNSASTNSSADRSSTALAAVLGFFTASSSTVETLSDGSRSTAVVVAQAFATTLPNGQTTTSYGSFQPVSSSAVGYAALTDSSDISSASVALSSQNADISSRLSSLNAAASTATGSARSSYSSEAVVLQSAASSVLLSASSALSSAASRISLEASSASADASSSADSSFPSSSAGQTSFIGGTPTATAPSSASSTSSSNNNSDDTPPPSVLAGGIVGGVAGLAVLVLTAMIFLRWYRKRMAGMNALTGAEAALGSGGAGGMSERGRTAPVLAPLLGGVFKNRKSRAVQETTGERGFQRISGRKLPSAFSAGMTSAPPPMVMPSAFDSDRNMSTTSVYRDSTYYGAGGSPFDDPDNEIGTNETIMPGPARQARVHPPYAMSPTSALSENASPTSPTFPIQGYRLTPESGHMMSSFDGSRGSRFTEEV